MKRNKQRISLSLSPSFFLSFFLSFSYQHHTLPIRVPFQYEVHYILQSNCHFLRSFFEKKQQMKVEENEHSCHSERLWKKERKKETKKWNEKTKREKKKKENDKWLTFWHWFIFGCRNVLTLKESGIDVVFRLWMKERKRWERKNERKKENLSRTVKFGFDCLASTNSTIDPGFGLSVNFLALRRRRTTRQMMQTRHSSKTAPATAAPMMIVWVDRSADDSTVTKRKRMN
jgi:hypothetical protein